MKYIFGNWKMNMSKDEILQFTKHIKTNKDAKIGVAVSSIYYGDCIKLQKQILIGVQNVSAFTKGAYTGEISANMLKDCKVDFCLVGHSERRLVFKETNQDINEKIKRLQENDILPILCMGESLEEFENGETSKVLLNQIKLCTKNIDLSKKIIFAYEPVWAIGTGKSASLDIIEQVCAFIREKLKTLNLNQEIIILYGGIVNENNCKQILNLANVDGVLVGGASNDATKFNAIINSV